MALLISAGVVLLQFSLFSSYGAVFKTALERFFLNGKLVHSVPRMNTALKHWKEAATVIISAGRRPRLPDHGLTKCLDHRGLDKGTSTPATPATEGLAHFPHTSTFDYDVLLLKRSGKSGFMPNAYVFPGGLVEPSDFSNEWLDIFKAFGRSPNFGLGTVKQPPATRPPIFATDRLKLGSSIPGDVAFRICAVRETFEESGVLLVVPKEEEDTLLKNIENKSVSGSNQTDLTSLYKLCDDSELAQWRVLVNEDPCNFITMCRQLQCLPNIWALHEWGNWLTPSGVYEKQRRYDTAFFMCCLQETPDTLPDEKEILHFKWSPPADILRSFLGRQLWIAPPQFYDLSRMCRFPSLVDLHDFASRRAMEGCEQWLPVRLVTDTVYISLLPGDSLYPEDGSGQIDLNKTTDASLQDLEENSALHRIVCHDLHTAAVQISITPKYNHLLPFGDTSLRRDTKSQL